MNPATMESCKTHQDPQENGTATSSGLLSRSLQIAHGMLEPSSFDCSGNDWHLDRQSPALPNSQFLGMHLPPYGVSTSQLYTSPSQPTLHNSMYNSTFPYHSGWEESYGTCTVASQESVPSTVATSFQSPHAYPYSYPAASLQTNYSYSSIMDESPISSPESIDSFTDGLSGNYNLGSQSSLVQPNSPLIDHTNSISNTAPPTIMMNFETQSSYSRMGYSAPVSMNDNRGIKRDTKPLKKAIMPQRKGGIQLWQFLYGLLMDSKHSDIIEWTSNRLLNEFRLVEPESIAVWWGTIKSKPTMTYDKFSRSLRYYYHKGILKKIPGERYVYRFLVDPEDMYKHIGTTDKRPEIKAMPKEAKMVMNIFQKKPTFSSDQESTRLPIVTKPPEGIQTSPSHKLSPLSNGVCNESISSNFSVHSFATDFNNSNNTCTRDNRPVFSLIKSEPISIPAW